MSDHVNFVTVFRSADEDAEDDARAIADALTEQNLTSRLLDDTEPGVPEGVWEVQVPAEQSARAEQVIAATDLPEDEFTEVSDSHGLDSETVFMASGGPTSEMEATAVQSVLEDGGIATVLVGNSVLPNLPFEVQVAKDQAANARRLIAEAEAAGPAAAEEAERATENQ